MQVTERPLADIRPYDKNPRNNRDAVKDVAASIQEYGFRQPLVVDEDGVIIVGHTRLLAAQRLGLETVPVHVAEGLTPEQARAYRLADNRTGENASWDEGLLKFELEELLNSDFDLDLTGFTGPEINSLLDPEVPDGDNDLILPPEHPVAEPGDIWQCGPHRIVCGDATDKASVDALGFDGYLMVTDPPYGVGYEPEWRHRAERPDGTPYGASAAGKPLNDHCADWRAAWGLFTGDVIYQWAPGGSGIVLHAAALEAVNFDIRSIIVWRKSYPRISRGHYHSQHELCLYGVRGGAKARWCGDRKQSTFWDIESLHGATSKGLEDEGLPHSTQKPVECMARPIRNHTKPKGKVYDPFLGSGTTLVAAQQLGRIGYGIEISPAYVDVACQRLEKHVGELAKKITEI